MIYFVRHGETDFNAQARCMGWIDKPLNDNGFAQVGELAEKLKDIEFSKIFCSPLLRARQTAEAINKFHNVPIEFVEDLKERYCGSRQGVCYKDLTKEEDYDFFYHPEKYGAEGDKEFYGRCANAFKEIQDVGEENVLIVSHGGTFRAVCCYVLNTFDPDDSIWRLKNCEVAKIDKDEITKI